MRPNVVVSLKLGGGAGSTLTRAVAVADGAAAGEAALVGIFGVAVGDGVGAATSAIGNAAMTAAKTALRTNGRLIDVLRSGLEAGAICRAP